MSGAGRARADAAPGEESRIDRAAGRLDGLKKRLTELGGTVEAFYLTLGPYGTVTVLTLPDDETMAALALSLGASGDVRTVTMRAFPEPEYREILRGVKPAT